MAIVNITTQNDADFCRPFALQATDGTPIDMTGASLEMMLRRHAADETAVLRLGTDTGELVITDPVNGQFTLRITQDVLVHLELGQYDQSNIMSRGDGSKFRVWTGTLINNPGPTR